MTEAFHHFVGGGIAALAGAVFLIRDHGVRGDRIVIHEAGRQVGGALDGGRLDGSAHLIRGARMFEENFVCTLDLMRGIADPDAPERSLADDLAAFNAANPVPYSCDRVARGQILGEHPFPLEMAQVAELLRLAVTPEARLEGKRIAELFDRRFFDSARWLGLSASYAFQPWHSAAEFHRYIHRFLHFTQAPGRRGNVLTTRFNQYDSLVAPILAWLRGHGVAIRHGAAVRGVGFDHGPPRRITALHLGGDGPVPVTDDDRVYLTLGSITDGAAIGIGAARRASGTPRPSWELWRDLADAAPGFGRPEVFAGPDARTGWMSFTLTLRSDALARHLDAIRPPGSPQTTILAFRDSPWRASLAPVVQPHFRDQPDGVQVIWGYGLRPDRPGTHCGVPLADASQADLFTELAGLLGMDPPTAARAFADARAVFADLPRITSQFMPRRAGDRPEIRPEGAGNFACLGQFVEQPADCVFTVEYSVRSAWAAVDALNPGGPPPPPVVRPDHDPRVLARALGNVLHRAPGHAGARARAREDHE